MIYHWCLRADWEAIDASYLPAEFDADGFIHCSFLDQIERTATAVDRGKDDLVLLTIDETGLPLTVEDCYEVGEPFPHVYGPIPKSAVVAVAPFPPNLDGSFSLPQGIT